MAKKIGFEILVMFSAVAVFLVILILPIISLAKESDDLHIILIDVGYGDAMVLHQPNSCSILIDAGEFFDATKIANTLNDLGVKTLDMVIISHPHIDHFGGLFDILPEFPATKFFDNGYEMERHSQFDEYKKLRDLQPYSKLTYGDEVRCGNVKISVLNHPLYQKTVTNINNTSLVLMISYKDFRLIHMADLELDGEKKLMESNHDLKANVIRISHGGINDATSKALLTRTSPDYAVISSSGECSDMVGCSPDELVLNRLADLNISHFRTDRDGDIEIRVNQDGFNITSSSTQ